MIKKYLEDLENGIAFLGIRKYPEKKNTDLMFHARRMHDLIKENKCKKIVELGTGHGQGYVLFANSVEDGGKTHSIDIRKKNADIVAQIYERYPSKNPALMYIGDSRSESFVNMVMQDNIPVDALFIDSLHTRKQVIEELLSWLPHLSSDCIIFFHDVVWCHDSVKVLVDDILNDFKTYKFCIDFNEKKTQIEKWAGSLGRVGLENGRPIIQSDSEIYDAPEYAKDRKIIASDYRNDDLEYNENEFDFKYEILLEWPGMIILTKSNKCSWNSILEKVKNEYNKTRDSV